MWWQWHSSSEHCRTRYHRSFWHVPQPKEARQLADRCRKVVIASLGDVLCRGVSSHWEAVVMHVARKLVGALSAGEKAASESEGRPGWMTNELVRSAFEKVKTTGICDIDALRVVPAPSASQPPRPRRQVGSKRLRDRGCDIFIQCQQDRSLGVVAQLREKPEYRQKTASSMRKIVGWKLWRDLPKELKDDYVKQSRQPRVR